MTGARAPATSRHRQTMGLLLLGGTLTLSACAWIDRGAGSVGRGPELGRVIAALPEAVIQTPEAITPDIETVMAAYAEVHGRLTDPALDQAVGRRLADLSMMVAEDHDAAGHARPYQGAIARYEGLLIAAMPDQRDAILYQLARAHDLAGAPDRSRTYLSELIAKHPESPFRVEAHFRLAEQAFSAQAYALADQHYQPVTEAGPTSPYWLNATYMSGWARFKDGDPAAALERFFAILETLAITAGPPDAQSASGNDQELHADTLRVVTLALDGLEGPVTLSAEMRRLAQPDWQHAVYQALADHYLQRERFLDSVTTWQTFIAEHPLDPRAPSAHRGIIETLLAADFPNEARESQAAFINNYGIRSSFWAAHDETRRADYLPALKGYLDQLARLEHAAAQAGDTAAQRAAVRWYDELIETFPADPDLPTYLFLLAELLTEAEDHGRAVATYQRVMREFPDHPDAADAGYAAVLGLAALTTEAEAPGMRTAHQHLRIAAQLEFTEQFPLDRRTPGLRVAAADALFGLDDFAAAQVQAERLLDEHPELEPELRRTTLTVLGHSQFELERYEAAEAAYRELLGGTTDPAQRDAFIERILAAVYRQAEASERTGAIDAALAHYLRMVDIAPDAELTIQGHYDAVAVAEANDRTADAARLLESFRTRYPNHPLTQQAPRRLAGLYEASGDRRLAARAYLAIADNDADPDARRQALYRAAELEIASGRAEQAEQHFIRYVRAYPQPWDLHLEALEQLDRLTQVSGRGDDRRQWLAAKVAFEAALRTAGSDVGLLDRAAYLAAGAQLELALQARLRFDGVRLVNPLADSLRRKQAALRETLSAFEAVAAYRVAEYAAVSTYQIADVYAALARALLESERPADLSALELEQYELLLEEQAYPFEEQAIAVHELNMQRSWEGYWDIWVERSFAELGRLVPARFARQEVEVVYVESIH